MQFSSILIKQMFFTDWKITSIYVNVKHLSEIGESDHLKSQGDIKLALYLTSAMSLYDFELYCYMIK